MKLAVRVILIVLYAAALAAADLRLLPGTNLFVMLPEELAAYEPARSVPFAAFKGMIYDMRRVWGSINPDDRYIPASDITASAGRDADVIRKQLVVGVLAPCALTAAEIAKCNGRGGKPKYIAYDGIVFDFSRIPWGSRYHPVSALGRDNTAVFIRTCGECHGPDVFSPFPVVGVLTNK